MRTTRKPGVVPHVGLGGRLHVHCRRCVSCSVGCTRGAAKSSKRSHVTRRAPRVSSRTSRNVGWKFGLQYRDAAGTRQRRGGLAAIRGDPDYFDWNTGTHRRRFDRNRFGLFHYLLYAHARGNRKSDFPCLSAASPRSTPATMTSGVAADNPDFHRPIERGPASRTCPAATRW